MTLHQNVIGVDVAKDWIDAFISSSGRAVRIDTSALRRFVRGLAGSPGGCLVVFEASGGYERPLMEALERRGILYARVNPRHAREFARCTGKLAKTDKVDAAMLADMGRKLELQPTPPLSPARRRLADLVARREDIVGMLVAEEQRLSHARDAHVRRSIGRVIAMLKAQRLAAGKEIAAAIRAEEELSRLYDLLLTAPGIGPALAAILIARLSELGSCDRRAIASLAGLAPHACDSGQRRGKRKVWGGRSDVRRALYIAAFVASRRDPALKAMRQRLEDAGKPAKAAILACARKLLTILNAMVRDGRKYA